MATKYRIPKLDDIQGGINAFDDLAETIANPPSGRPLRQAIGNAGRLYCDFVGSQPGQAILPWTGQGLVAPLLCKPYWDDEGYDAPEEVAPFTGGQCEGTGYRATASFVVNVRGADDIDLGDFSATVEVFTITYNGPISSASIELRGTGGTGGTTNLCQLIVTDAGGLRPAITLTSRGNPGRLTNLRPGAISFARISGNPDICGDPPGVLGPGSNPPPTPTFPEGEGPGTEPDGQPFFFVPPIDSPIGGDPIDVPPQPQPDSPVDDTPTDPGDAGDPEETGPGGESSGVAPAGSELTGVFVEIVEFPENAARFQNNQRQPFRGAGYIAMGWPDLLGVDISGGVINPEQFFHAQQRGVTCWRVTANTGFDLRCTPYYREVNPEEEEE